MSGPAPTTRRRQSRAEPLPGFWVWPFCCAVIMAHHVGGKAARDGFFLSTFGAHALPLMIAGGAGFALLAGWMSGKLMLRHSPRTVAPRAFVLSGALQVGEWYFLQRNPAPASVVIFLHMAGLGAVLLSSFWSILSEEFDPREAKRKFGLIAAGGTAGGVAGAFSAERVIALFGAPALLLVLAGLHFGAAALLGAFVPAAPGRKALPSESGGPAFRLLLGSDYLLKLSLLIVAAATGTALLDYVFKVQAAATWGKGPVLIRFLALYHGGVALLTLCSQWLVTKRSLESLGLGRTVAALPAVLAGGSLLALAVPGFVATALARTLETAVRNSLFRTGYEVCFTPIPPSEKRRLKTTIDVGAERAGDALGGGIALLCLWLTAANSRSSTLLVAAAIGVAVYVLARLLDAAYVNALALSLTAQKVVVEPETVSDLTTRAALTQSGLFTTPGPVSCAVPAAADLSPRLHESHNRFQQFLRELQSPDPAVVSHALGTADLSDPVLASLAIPLLGRPELSDQASHRLQRAAGSLLGLLTDYLARPTTELSVRRRIPRILGSVASERSLQGLLVGLDDARFEVRMNCARVLLKLTRQTPVTPATRERILAIVNRELSRGKVIWESQRMQADRDAPEWLDEFLRDRAHASLEYVFSLLSTLYDREPLMVAFRSLHTDDRRLRGTALEYLQGILPASTRNLLWDILGEHPAAGPPRQAEHVMNDLIDASPTVFLRLQDMQQNAANDPAPVRDDNDPERTS